MALIALFATTPRSTNRSTHSLVISQGQLQNVTADRGLMLWARPGAMDPLARSSIRRSGV
jgi:hypothetical protein